MKKNYIIIKMIITIFTKIDALQALESTFDYNPTTESFEYQPNVTTDIKEQDHQTRQAIQSFIPSIQKMRPMHQSAIASETLTPSHQLIMKHLQQKYNNHGCIDNKIILRSFDEFHIDTHFITDENIDNFIKKFNSETELFQSKLSNLWTEISDTYDQFKNPGKKVQKNSEIKFTEMNREQAILKLRTITENIFDPNDKQSLSTYLSEMKIATQYLDQDKDSTIIQSIDFLQKNQHRNSIWDLPFWKDYAQTINPKDFHPITQDSAITKIPLLTKINTLQNKIDVSTEKE